MNRRVVRTTVEIPNSLHRKLKARAAQQGTSMRELILSGVRAVLSRGGQARSHRVKFPLIVSDGPKVDVPNQKIVEK